jgi:hypothetical protein
MKRRFRAVRWDRDNADCLCHECHQFFETRPIEYAFWWRTHGTDPSMLEQRANEPWNKDYGPILERLTEEVAAMKERTA